MRPCVYTCVDLLALVYVSGICNSLSLALLDPVLSFLFAFVSTGGHILNLHLLLVCLVFRRTYIWFHFHLFAYFYTFITTSYWFYIIIIVYFVVFIAYIEHGS